MVAAAREGELDHFGVDDPEASTAYSLSLEYMPPPLPRLLSSASTVLSSVVLPTDIPGVI